MNNTDRLCLGCMNDNGGAAVCPICGYDPSAVADDEVITAGTWIKERYLVGRVIETTGEGNTYIGWDNQNDNVVYIKEYFPLGLCERQKNKSVKITEGREYDFNNGIMTFIEISKKLSELDLPSLMPVVETLELGGSAYSIIKSSAGIPLREFLLRNGGVLKWEQAKPLFMPLLDTLEELHKAGIYHGGISPETVIVGRDGRLHLMGVSVPQLRDANSEFTSQIFPGFAAIEQYDPQYEIGAATDVYGVAATLFRVLIGNPPMAANERAVHDNMSIPAKAAETIPPYVLTALANALQIDPANRTSGMAALHEDFSRSGGTGVVPAPVPGDKSKNGGKGGAPAPKMNKNLKYGLITAGITVGALLILAIILILILGRDSIFGGKDTSSVASVSAPSVSSFGDVDSTYSAPNIETLYEVPDFAGKSYAEISADSELGRTFKITIKGTEFNNRIAAGHVISQTVAAGEKKAKDTEIQLVISLGNAEIKVPNLAGTSEIEAYIALLELGLSKDNIEFVERYDENAEPQLIISTSPAAGESISRFDSIEVYVNTYEEITNEYDAFEGVSSAE
ncbi:MAG: PASTA domain-containing protein [Clostridia bacterium]|nr:PASTA domain-containing protein [Clostridia bacterium]